MLMKVAEFERLFRQAAGLDVDKNDLKRVSDFLRNKLYDLLAVAERNAKYNGRDLIFEPDLPIAKGLQETLQEFRRMDTALELKPVLDALAALPPLDPRSPRTYGTSFPSSPGPWWWPTPGCSRSWTPPSRTPRRSTMNGRNGSLTSSSSVSQDLLLQAYRRAIRLVFNLVVVALLVGLFVGTWRTFLELGLTLTEPTVRLGLKELITNVLSLVIVLELVRAFVEYFEVERVRLEILLEIGIALALRELLLLLYEARLSGMDVFFWGLGILALAAGRTLAVQFSPRRAG